MTFHTRLISLYLLSLLLAPTPALADKASGPAKADPDKPGVAPASSVPAPIPADGASGSAKAKPDKTGVAPVTSAKAKPDKTGVAPASRPAIAPVPAGKVSGSTETKPDKPGNAPAPRQPPAPVAHTPALTVRPASDAPRFFQLALALEAGFLAPVDHSIQFGKGNAALDYVAEGGQDNLFFFWRIQAEVLLKQRHSLIFLYQPINVISQVTMPRDVQLYQTLFPKGTPTDIRYGFDFYRLTYHYDVLGRGRGTELGIGLGLQIRNAVINFSAVNGSARIDERNIGPVPLLKVRGRYTFDSGFWLGGEVDGFYAPIKYINGAGSDVEGAIIDLNLRAGMRLWRWADVFLNLRYLGGGAEGTSSGYEGAGDGFVANWLHFITVSLGVETWATDLW